MTLAYMAGLATIPVLFVLYVAGEMAVVRNLHLECLRCDRRFGITPHDAKDLGIKPTLNLATRFKFKWHRWTGECKEEVNR